MVEVITTIDGYHRLSRSYFSTDDITHDPVLAVFRQTQHMLFTYWDSGGLVASTGTPPVGAGGL